MNRKIGTWMALTLAVGFAVGARAELPDEGVANGRFVESSGFADGVIVDLAMHDEPGQPGGVMVSVFVNDWATGLWAFGEGLVPAPLASLTADHATATFDLSEVPGFYVMGCGYTEGVYECGPMAGGRVELTLSRTGDTTRENGTRVLEFPDGSARRVTRAGWTARATVEGTILGYPFPADASAKIGSYHLLVVSKTPAK